MKVINVVIAFIVGLVIGGLVLFGVMRHQQTPNEAQAEALIAKITKNQAVILQHFPAIGDIEGFVVTTNPPSDKKGILYVDNQGRFLVDGTLVDANGNDLMQKDYYQYIQPKNANTAYQTIAQTAYIQQGSDSASHKLYAVIDPNCIFCHKGFEALQSKISSGQLAVRWIVIGLIKPDSKAKALAILAASDPLAALQQNETAFNEQQEEGGITPLANASDAIMAKLNANMQFASANQVMQTPTFFYKDASGNMKIEAGMPQGAALDAFINKLSSQF